MNRLRNGAGPTPAQRGWDNDCWLAYSYFDACNRARPKAQHPHPVHRNRLHRGRRHRPRCQPAPDLHMAQTLEACRIMMGTSRPFDHRPRLRQPPTARTAHGNRQQSSGDWWEGQAWYSDRCPAAAHRSCAPGWPKAAPLA
ncbi:MAG: hypothetical protein R3A10_17000 [Caldilineaceae bacterium]